MLISFLVFLFWVAFFFAGRYAIVKWSEWRRRPARYVSEIYGLDYYRGLNWEQFEYLVLQTLMAGGYDILGEPYLEHTRRQGYAWKAGKKVVFARYAEKPLTPEDLEEVGRKQSLVKADQLLVFSPFPRAPRASNPAVKVLCGSKLASFFSPLDDVRPPVFQLPEPGTCDCGAPMETRVNRGGQYLLVCSRYPACKEMRKVEPFEIDAAKEAWQGWQ